jgi:superfamily II DNA or RNA helicase
MGDGFEKVPYNRLWDGINVKPLSEEQRRYRKDLLKIFENSSYAFDLSPTGIGKTYVALSLALEYNLPVIVVANRNAFEQPYGWKHLCHVMEIPG